MVALKALVVDDSGVMRKMVMKGLTDSKLADFEFVEATDGQDALSKFDPKEVDIGFVDWNMPNMTGIEFVREIRNLYGGGMAGCPLVMVTSEKTMGKIEEALDILIAAYKAEGLTPTSRLLTDSILQLSRDVR